jgi:hypothetical protein
MILNGVKMKFDETKNKKIKNLKNFKKVREVNKRGT